MSRRGENIYKRKDGRWEGRFIKGRREDNKIKYGYIYGKTYHEVKNKLYIFKAKYQNLRETNGDSVMPLISWGKYWLASIQDSVKQSTFASYEYKLTAYVYPSVGDYPLNELNKIQFQELITTWQKKGISNASIHVIYRLLNQCLNAAVERGDLTVNPCNQIQLPKIRRRRISSLSRGQQKEIEAAANQISGKGRLAVQLGLSAGLRIGKIAALRWEDVDFEKRLLRINYTYQRINSLSDKNNTKLYYTESKSDASTRLIPMTKKLLDQLKYYKKKSDSYYVLETQGKPCEPRLLTYHFHKIRDLAGLNHVHFHQLRHTFATRCIEKNADIASVSALLGHASTQMTLDTYADAMLEQRIQVIATLDQKGA
ncbi:tyrosine-type recombinase/integrase [Enterococcus alishanensis]